MYSEDRVSEKPIQLEFNYAPRELQMAILIAFTRSWAAWILLALPIFAVLIKAGLGGFADPGHAKVYLIFCGVMEIALLTVAPWRMGKVMTADGGRFAGPTQVTFANTGLQFNFNGGEAAFEWDQYARYCYRKGFLVLDMGRVISHCIPIRALDEAQLKHIDDFLESRHLTYVK